MAYIGSDGNLVNRKPWSVKSVIDFFWAFVAFFVLFFRGLFHLDDVNNRGQYGNGGGRAAGYAPAYPRRRMGGFSGGSGGPAPPPCGMGGG